MKSNSYFLEKFKRTILIGLVHKIYRSGLDLLGQIKINNNKCHVVVMMSQSLYVSIYL